MNGLHDHQHKRTSITELLNPVAATPSGSLDPSFNANQLSGIGVSQYVQNSHQAHVGGPGPYHPSLGAAGSSFSLRAASWDHGQGENQTAARRSEGDTASPTCQYGAGNSSRPHQSPPHHGPAYPDQYQQRPRMADPPANYGPDVQSWPHNSHEHPPVQYGAPVLSPVYSDERSGTPSCLSLCHLSS